MKFFPSQSTLNLQVRITITKILLILRKIDLQSSNSYCPYIYIRLNNVHKISMDMYASMLLPLAYCYQDTVQLQLNIVMFHGPLQQTFFFQSLISVIL